MLSSMSRRAVVSALAVAAAAVSLPAFAQAAPIKILVGFPHGGSADTTARLMAEKMSASLAVPVVVENRPGAGGRIAAQAVKDAAPDGNLLMLVPMAVMVVQPVVLKVSNTTRPKTSGRLAMPPPSHWLWLPARPRLLKTWLS
jgi:tripartite-type tricarboxylate transporter receptor subunit TctC